MGETAYHTHTLAGVVASYNLNGKAGSKGYQLHAVAAANGHPVSTLNGSTNCNGSHPRNGSTNGYASVGNGISNGIGSNLVIGIPSIPNVSVSNGIPENERQAPNSNGADRRRCFWYEEDLGEDLRWCFSLKRILHTGVSKFQDIALLDARPWGKVLILDGRMQSAEVDEFVYHECLVHPAMLHHSSPRNVFIMGGGEGSTAREVLKHKTVQKVVMCDIDREVVAFCKAHLPLNREAFHSSRFELVINDARAELEKREEGFDIVIGDLADPVEGGPCYQLYSKGFYERVLKPRLNPGGIFVTQAGPAGVLSHGEVFTSIYNTLRNVFKHVVAYATHIPSYADTWGWIMASDEAFSQSTECLDERIEERVVKGDLRFIDGATIHSSAVLNKLVRKALETESHVYTEESARFVYGKGMAATSSQ